ncbi:COG4280 domain-containing protein [Streptacidiphilus sp. EB103A]|uniref:COG4280 domain-containing protein n=1 Tax=Streptacidiphilus sp. EB103A TaxID=3156275 RepID=UPI00351191C5
MNAWILFLTVFLACAVEAVEALTIVLAAGTSRHWGSALQGTGAALLVLAATVAALGPAIGLIPLDPLRLVVGAFLLVFGLQWLRKAILRASGHKALHDEEAAYAKQVAAATAAATDSRGIVQDWYAFTLSFKGVLLEGLEVAFIVVTFGNNQRDVPVAALGALAAALAVAAVGVAVRAPLARVPENTMKFVVGTMLTAFGLFWSTEGAGAHWPGSDTALLVLVPAVALLALGYTALLRRPETPERPLPRTQAEGIVR